MHWWTWPQHVPAWKLSLACDKPFSQNSKLNFFKILHFSLLKYISSFFLTKIECILMHTMRIYSSWAYSLECKILKRSDILKNLKSLLKVIILGLQNFVLLDILEHFGSLQPNALGYWPKILHTACQATKSSSCKISACISNAENDFWLKNPQKRPKKCKKMFFLPFSPNYKLCYHKILHAWTWPQYVPTWKISLACHKPIFSKFNFEIFSIFCIFSCVHATMTRSVHRSVCLSIGNT